MTVQTVNLGGKRFVILPEKDFQRMSKALDDLAAQDRADIRTAKKRLSDPKEKPIPYENVRKELGLALKYSILMLPSAKKAMARLPKDRARVIDAQIMALADNPRPAGAIPLKGEGRGLWRIRSGDWRILYQIRDKELVIVVADIGHRRDVYRGL